MTFAKAEAETTTGQKWGSKLCKDKFIVSCNDKAKAVRIAIAEAKKAKASAESADSTSPGGKGNNFDSEYSSGRQ